MKRFSLRRRLTLLLSLSLVLVWAATLLLSYREAREEVNELFDARLEESARTLMLLDLKRLRRLSAAEDLAAPEDDHDRDHDVAQRLSFQVWNRDGTLLLRSAQAPAAAFENAAGFRTIAVGGRTWRSVSLWQAQHGLQVRVFEPLRARQELAARVSQRMLMPLLVALPALALLIWFSIGRGFRPLAALSRAIAARDADNLDRITVDQVPAETLPLIDSLNQLLQRLAASLDKERSFTADAAHELRTPLAAIKVQAEVALAAQDPGQRQRAVRHIVAGVDRTTHLVEQLLLLARIDHPDRNSWAPLDLGELAARCAARYADQAVGKDIELGVAAEAACLVSGDGMTLDVLIGNLIDNALRYTPAGGRVALTVARAGGRIVLAVRDNGPGIPAEARARIFDRFYRVGGHAAPGSGLGLSIVQRVAQSHGAEIDLDRGLDGRGLGLRLSFPPAAA
ncbi:MAG TPA: ATP-binding protein [Rhodocyclaceae bacterium]|nr:ATP-binding protein [Rhodocyclaceae bacterium]